MEIDDEVGMSPYDCVHAAVMKGYGSDEIASADKEFERVELINRLDPRNIS